MGNCILRRALWCLILFVCYTQLTYAFSVKDESGIVFFIHSEEDDTCSIVIVPNQDHVTIASSYSYKGKSYTPVEIEDGACMNNDLMTSIILPSTIKRLGQSAFNGCIKLRNISLPNGVTTINPYCFANCTSLTGFTAPAALTRIGQSAFSNSGIEHVELGEQIEEIGSSAFAHCEKLQGFRLSSLVIQTISRSLFRECNSLVGVTLPNTITSIESNAFENCSKLAAIDLPDSLRMLGGDAFEGCTSLTHVEMPSGVILGVCLRSYPFIKSIHFTKGSRPVIDDAFYFSMPNLKSLTFDEGITEITGSAFSGCDSLESVIFPTSMRYIRHNAFQRCESLEHVVLPPNLITIGDEVFSYCSSLKRIVLPVTLDTIGRRAFNDCIALEDVEFPRNLKVIGDDAFNQCSSLKSVKTGGELETIGFAAFERAGVQQLTLGESLKSIEDNAFAYCNITEVYSWNPQPPVIEFNTFNTVTTQNAILTVPAEAVDAYKEATYWKNFKNIVGKDLSAVNQIDNKDMSVVIQNGQIVVGGVKDVRIEVYNMQGHLVYCGFDTMIEMPTSGLYLVKVGTQVFKVKI